MNKKKIPLKLYTPDSTIASFIELPNGANPIEAIWHTSSVALDTEKICFIYTIADGGVYFISAPALSFLNYPNTTSPLACALPNNPFHQGDGAYICPIGSNLFAVVIKSKESLTSYIGDKSSALLFSANISNFWVENNTIPWLSLTQYQQQETTRLVSLISFGSFLFIILLLALSTIFQYQGESYKSEAKIKQNKIAKLEEKNMLVINMNNQNNTDNKILHKYLELSSYVMSQNGRITAYEYKNNHIKYIVELPQTVNNFAYFGKEVVPIIKNEYIEIQKEENL